MTDDFSSFSAFDTKAAHKPLEGLQNDIVVTQGKQASILEIDEPVAIDPFTTKIRYDSYPTNIAETTVVSSRDQEPCILDYWIESNLHDDDNINSIPLPAQSKETSSDETERMKHQPNAICTASFRILGNYGIWKERSKNGLLSNQSSNTLCSRKLSTEEIMRVAGERFILFSNKKVAGNTQFIHPYGSALSNLPTEEIKMVDLAHLLLASAEKVGYKQFNSADELLLRCESMASESGNPVERLVFYFSTALRRRIKTETESDIAFTENEQVRDHSGLSSGVDFNSLALHQEVPFCKVMQFASVQIMLENVAKAKKIHVIDLQLKDGIQWTCLIQALSERKSIPVKLLKITALETINKEKAEKSGKMLLSYAKSMDIPLAFKVVFISNMKDLKVELFDIKPAEAVVIYSPVVLRAMIPKPENLQILLGVIQRMRPSIMVVTEVEASHNSTSFVQRFIEALFFYSAWYDALEDCMGQDNHYRMNVERIFGQGIQNIVATEGEERTSRSVTINVWRAFFTRFKMEEIELSKASLDQASMVLKQQFSCGSSCTINKNGKCLIVGWKGTPLQSVSAWKFR